MDSGTANVINLVGWCGIGAGALAIYCYLQRRLVAGQQKIVTIGKLARQVAGLFYGINIDKKMQTCKIMLHDGPKRYAYHYFAGLCADIYEVRASRLLLRLRKSGFCLIFPDMYDRFVLAYMPKQSMSASCMLIIIRGTKTTEDILTDLNAQAHTPELTHDKHDKTTIEWWLRQWSSDCTAEEVQTKLTAVLGSQDPIQLHKGFWTQAMMILTEISKTPNEDEFTFEPTTNILLTGHSLGGAVAQCLTLILSVIRSTANSSLVYKQITCLTYGQPKIYCTAIPVGENNEWVKTKKAHMKELVARMKTHSTEFCLLRVVSEHDLVPALPPPFPDLTPLPIDGDEDNSPPTNTRWNRFMHQVGCILIQFVFHDETREDLDPLICTTDWTRSFDNKGQHFLVRVGLLVKAALGLPTHSIGIHNESHSRCFLGNTQSSLWYSYKQLLRSPKGKGEMEPQRRVPTNGMFFICYVSVALLLPVPFLWFILDGRSGLVFLAWIVVLAFGGALMWICWPRGAHACHDIPRLMQMVCPPMSVHRVHAPQTGDEYRLMVNPFRRF
jgi:hypothetical protein